MPGKATIVIEAQTAEALARIQQFARGMTDAFSAVKAGDPILQGASVKVQSLTAAKWAASRRLMDLLIAMKAPAAEPTFSVV